MALRKGRDKAYIDLVSMESDILALMKKPFPIIVALGIGAQLALTTFMIWYSQGTMHPPAMNAAEPGSVFRKLLADHPARNTLRRSTTNMYRESSSMEEGGIYAQQQQDDRERDLAHDDETPVDLPAAWLNSSSSLLQDYHEMDSFSLRRRESGRDPA